MRFFGGLGLLALLVSGLTYLWLLGLWLGPQTQVRPAVLGAPAGWRLRGCCSSSSVFWPS